MINVAEILKQVPKGTKLWSNMYGDVELNCIENLDYMYPINVLDYLKCQRVFTKYGCFCEMNQNEECTLWPSKDHRAWDDEAYKILGIEKKPEIPFNLQPFDKVLARDLPDDCWRSDFFSFIYSGEGNPFHFICVGNQWKYCIPYNDETKHLLGTTHEPPEKYRQ